MKVTLSSFLPVFVTLWFVSASQASEIRCDTEINTKTAGEEGYLPLKAVSIFALIADPEKYHGQRVSVVGAFRLYFDRLSIYATSEHLAADELSSMAWSELPRCVDAENMEEMSEWQGQFVRVDGVFNAKLKSFAAGTLEAVELVVPWNRREADQSNGDVNDTGPGSR